MSENFTVSHIGVVVTDLDRSTQFYCDGLGFENLFTYETGSEIAKLADLDPDVQMTGRFLRKPGIRLELMLYKRARPSTGPRPMDQIGGPTHMALRVEDMDAAIAAVRKFGGTVNEYGRTKYEIVPGEDIELVHCLDPDGMKLELVVMGPVIRKQMDG